jgi:hypothetical protein
VNNVAAKTKLLIDANAPFIDEWHKERNHPLFPQQVTSKTKKKVWWKCRTCSHEWEARVESRWRNGCPECGKRKNIENRRKHWVSLAGSLEETHPEIACQWHPENGLLANQVTSGSSESVLWRCNEGHEWKTAPSNRVNSDSGCPVCSGKRLFSDAFPELLTKQFAADLNPGVSLTQLTLGSGKKIWWRCEVGHEWKAALSSRARANRNCPYCAGQKATSDRNLAFDNPYLAAQWDYKKNGTFTPKDFLSGSGKKIWWSCEHNHSWRATIASRNSGLGCPFCGNKVVDEGNNLAVLHPEIAEQWNFEKNDPLTPNQFVPGSGAKVWWKCKRGHAWQANIASRANYGTQCPQCRAPTSRIEIRVLCEIEAVFGDAKWREKINGSECDIFLPQLGVCIEVDGYPWHKNKLIADSNKTQKFESLGYVVMRLRDINLPFINGNVHYFKDREEPIGPIKSLVGKIAEIATKGTSVFSRAVSYIHDEKYWAEKVYHDRLNNLDWLRGRPSISQTHPKLIQQWDNELNVDLDPDAFSSGSETAVWWKCENNHQWKAAIKNRAKGTGCPYCSNALTNSENSLATNCPELAAEWGQQNKNLTPDDVTLRSSQKVWWKCKKCNEEWEARVVDRHAKSSGCPYCSGKKKTHSDSLSFLRPELMKEWDFEKNVGIDPTKLGIGSHVRVSWKCFHGHIWDSEIRVRATRGQGNCPICKKGSLNATM